MLIWRQSNEPKGQARALSTREII